MAKTNKRLFPRHRHHCQCPRHRDKTPRPKYPKWGWILIRSPRSGRIIRVHPRWWAQFQGRLKAIQTLRNTGKIGCFDSESGRAAVLTRWRRTRKNPKTGKYIVKLATARRLQRWRDNQENRKKLVEGQDE